MAGTYVGRAALLAAVLIIPACGGGGGGGPTAPAAPSGLAATPGDTQVALTWTGSAGATSYNVYRATIAGGPYTNVANVAVTNHTDPGLANGTPYFYVVRAVNGVGESANSNEATATPIPPPPAPTGLAATPGNTQVALTWNASATATSYNVYRATVTGGPYTLVINVAVTNHADTGLTNGTAYFYVVRAVNGSGESGNSTEASATPIPPPLAPTGLTATPGDTQVALTWNASAGATSYSVHRGTTTTGPYSFVATVGVTNYTNSSLTNGTTYYFVVTAANGSGTSPNSNEASASPLPPPLAPTGLTATWGNTQVALTWTASATATSYTVHRGTTTTGPYSLVATVGVTNHTDTGLTNGTTYFYVVRAVNSAGPSGNSNEVSGSPATIPAAPGSPSAVPGDGQITLSWGAVGGTTGYRIERSLVTGGPYAFLVNVGTTNHIDTGLTNGTAYFYVIKGVNGSVIGPASSEVTATPAVALTFNQARGVDYQVWAVAAATDGTNDVYIGGELRSFNTQAVGGIVRLNSDGTHDPAFIMGTGTRTGYVRAIAPLANGDVYIGGEFTEYNLTAVNRIVRLDSNGSIDAGFVVGSGFNGQVNVIVPDGSGNVVVGGTFTTYKGASANRIVRLDATGTVDPTFAMGTAFSAVGTYVATIAIDGSGNVVVGGQFDRYNGTLGLGNIVRLTNLGAIDGTFTATSGGAVNAVVVAADATGDLYVAGPFSTFNSVSQNSIVRISSTGSTVGSFVAGGGFGNVVNSVVASGSGVFVGGLFSSYKGTAVGRITRLDNTGTIDAAFVTGTGFNSDVQTIAPDGSGGVLVGGLFTAYSGVGVDRAARLNAAGTLVNLPTGAGFSNPANALAFVPSTTDVYVGGSFTHYDGTPSRGLVRLNSNGTIDPTLAVGTGFVGAVNALAVAGTGDLYVGGGMSSYKGTALGFGIVRLNPDGTIDTGFVTGAGFDGTVWAIAMAPDASGDLYVAGQFTTWKGAAASRIVRLDSAGTIVPFTAGTGFDGAVFSLAIDGSGNVIAGGDFGAYNGTGSVRIAKLSSAGAIDTAFATNTGTGFTGAVNAVAIDGSGDIYAAGAFGQFNGGTANRVARLNSDGSVDGAFVTGTGFNGIASALAVAPGGDVYVGGNFSSYKLSPVRPLIRLNSDGSVDGGFPASIAATVYAPGQVTVIAMLPDASGRLYMGGNIGTWAGTTFDFFARLTAAGAVE